jgi:hypothetical protein
VFDVVGGHIAKLVGAIDCGCVYDLGSVLLCGEPLRTQVLEDGVRQLGNGFFLPPRRFVVAGVQFVVLR